MTMLSTKAFVAQSAGHCIGFTRLRVRFPAKQCISRGWSRLGIGLYDLTLENLFSLNIDSKLSGIEKDQSKTRQHQRRLL